MAEPVKGVAYDFYMSLDAQATSGFQDDPTIEAGDFQISKDGGAFSNLTTLPTVTPSGSPSVRVQLSATEMDADKVYIVAEDQSGAEWNVAVVFIDVPEGSSQSVLDILEGDHRETSTSAVIYKKNTTTPVLSKTVSGSLLNSAVTITTTESS